MTSVKSEEQSHLERVRGYYDACHKLFVEYMGSTFQGGYFISDPSVDEVLTSNLRLAEHAGIRPGDRVLDAGCGVCGPAIDIARAIDVTIDAITISQAQVDTAREYVAQAGLSDRIRVHLGDYHYLPFPDATFDMVYFFEAAGHSDDRARLFGEVSRVLRPGGRLYIKDVFAAEPPLTDVQQNSLEQFRKIYANCVPAMSEVAESIRAAGFEDLRSADISAQISMQRYASAMVREKDGVQELTELGKVFHQQLDDLRLVFGEFHARKPQ